jgi:hypothetical protein
MSYSISGNAAGVAGAIVIALGGAFAIADGLGNYVITGFADGTYRVSVNGHVTSPDFRDVTVSGADVTGVDFTLVLPHSITGNAAGVAGVQIALIGPVDVSGIADGSGNYEFTGLYDGSYTVQPSKTGYVFSPLQRDVTVSGADVTGVDFTLLPTYSISGNVGLSDVQFPGQPPWIVSDGAGNYVLDGFADGTYRVWARLDGYAFTPDFRDVTVSGAGVTGVDFAARRITNSGDVCEVIAGHIHELKVGSIDLPEFRGTLESFRE